MSKFLSLRSDPICQPAAKNPLERQTWCSLRIQVGSRFASRLWDNSLEDERDALDVPAFPIAEWLIKNWWSLFNELCPGNSVPRHRDVSASWRSWIRRHCLRSADSSLFLPKLYVYADGQDLVAESQADRPGTLPNMPGEFLTDGIEVIDAAATESALSKFINQSLSRVKSVEDDKLTRAAGQWRAIQNADEEEAEFCRLAGRMGLDPYDPEEMSAYLADFFEAILADSDKPLVRDLTEVAKPDSVQAQWDWVKQASLEFHLGPRSADLPFELPSSGYSPADYGYELAHRVRAFVNAADDPIRSVEETASAAIRRSFEVVDKNHIPGQEIKAIVGQSTTDSFIAAGPTNPIYFNQRFMNARSLFHVLATSQHSPRLVTGAYSLDQKASRAFAAEFLAPRRALMRGLANSTADPETVDRLSKQFQASPYVIQLQLENAGVALSSD